MDYKGQELQEEYEEQAHRVMTGAVAVQKRSSVAATSSAMVAKSSGMTETLSKRTPSFLRPVARKWVLVSRVWPLRISSPMMMTPALWTPAPVDIHLAAGTLTRSDSTLMDRQG